MAEKPEVPGNTGDSRFVEGGETEPQNDAPGQSSEPSSHQRSATESFDRSLSEFSQQSQASSRESLPYKVAGCHPISQPSSCESSLHQGRAAEREQREQQGFSELSVMQDCPRYSIAVQESNVDRGNPRVHDQTRYETAPYLPQSVEDTSRKTPALSRSEAGTAAHGHGLHPRQNHSPHRAMQGATRLRQSSRGAEGDLRAPPEVLSQMNLEQSSQQSPDAGAYPALPQRNAPLSQVQKGQLSAFGPVENAPSQMHPGGNSTHPPSRGVMHPQSQAVPYQDMMLQRSPRGQLSAVVSSGNNPLHQSGVGARRELPASAGPVLHRRFQQPQVSEPPPVASGLVGVVLQQPSQTPTNAQHGAFHDPGLHQQFQQPQVRAANRPQQHSQAGAPGDGAVRWTQQALGQQVPATSSGVEAHGVCNTYPPFTAPQAGAMAAPMTCTDQPIWGGARPKVLAAKPFRPSAEGHGITGDGIQASGVTSNISSQGNLGNIEQYPSGSNQPEQPEYGSYRMNQNVATNASTNIIQRPPTIGSPGPPQYEEHHHCNQPPHPPEQDARAEYGSESRLHHSRSQDLRAQHGEIKQSCKQKLGDFLRELTDVHKMDEFLSLCQPVSSEPRATSIVGFYQWILRASNREVTQLMDSCQGQTPNSAAIRVLEILSQDRLTPANLMLYFTQQHPRQDIVEFLREFHGNCPCCDRIARNPSGGPHSDSQGGGGGGH